MDVGDHVDELERQGGEGDPEVLALWRERARITWS
jgi:hypothetical protein